MKFPFWTDPNDNIAVLDLTDEAIDEYGHLSGSDFVRLQKEHMDALNAGKVLAWNDGEYSTFVVSEDAAQKALAQREEEERHGGKP